MSSRGWSRSAWYGHVPTSGVDREAFLFMGPDPCWSPDKEFKAAGCPDAAPGLCRLCGGDPGFPLLDADGLPVFDRDGVPLVASEVPPGSHRVCARCGRSGFDQHSRGIDPPARLSAGDPGYVSRDGVTVPERYRRLLEG